MQSPIDIPLSAESSSVNAAKFVDATGDETTVCYNYGSSLSGKVSDKGTTLQMDLSSGSMESVWDGV